MAQQHLLSLFSLRCPSTHGTGQVARMQRQVDDLQAALLKSLHERGQPTIIVNGSGRGTG